MRRILTIAATLILVLSAAPAFASTGTIDATYHYAWNDNGGWVNWDPTNGDVSVTATALTGYIWSADFGWINLAPSEGGVTNDGQGTLGGYAWGENTGWISFSGVTIDSSGVFHGHTVAQNVFGTITFDCTNCKVVTSWRPATSGGSSGSSGGGGGGTISGPISVGYQINATSTGSGSGATSPSTATGETSSNPSNATPVPPTLIPTSRPPTVKPATKPPTSPASVSYIVQQVQGKPRYPVVTQPTHTAPAPIPVIPPAQGCSWWGSCLWQAVVGFIAMLFQHRSWQW
jgi:hypothetical protein